MLPEGPSRDPPEEPKIGANWPKVVFGVAFWTDRLQDTIFLLLFHKTEQKDVPKTQSKNGAKRINACVRMKVPTRRIPRK